MARVFAGNPSGIDHAVLEAVAQLPDEFIVCAEVTLNRNADVLIFKSNGNEKPAVVVVTECKRVATSLRGNADGLWERLEGDEGWRPVPAGRDINPYWQAVNTANAFQAYLQSNQSAFRDEPSAPLAGPIKVWPDLLILAPEGIQHQLPPGPPSRYGKWFTDLDSWREHLLSWEPRFGIPLSEAEILRLVSHLHLVPIDASGRARAVPPAAAKPAAPPVPRQGADTELVATIGALSSRLQYLEAQLADRRAEHAPIKTAGGGILARWRARRLQPPAMAS